MSILRVDNASPSVGGTSYNLSEGILKTGVIYDQAANSVLYSFNSSSTTDTAAGDFSVSYTNLFDTASYLITGLREDNNNTTIATMGIYESSAGGTDPTTSSSRFSTFNSSSGAVDALYSNTSMIGDLA